MAKTIVTHVNPDLDAIASVWLLLRFGGNEFKRAEFQFVPAGQRYGAEDNNTVHVDTGLGKFDHHQEESGLEDTCAAKLVYRWLIKEGRISEQEPLSRIVEIVNEIDHFKNYFWAEPANDRYEFFLDEVLHGVRMGDGVRNDEDLVKLGMVMLDGILVGMKAKVAAEEEIKKSVTFTTKWGKAVGVESGNNNLEKLALKMGYNLVIRKDLEFGPVRIKAAPLPEIDLNPVYAKLAAADQAASWYFHPSGKMILNGSIRNPEMVPSKLDLSEIIKLVKSIK